MKKIIMAALLAATTVSGMGLATIASAGKTTYISQDTDEHGNKPKKILNDLSTWTHQDGKYVNKLGFKARKACGGTSWIPYIGQATCAGLMTSFFKDKTVNKVVSIDELKEVREAAIVGGATFFIPGQGFTSAAWAAMALNDIDGALRAEHRN